MNRYGIPREELDAALETDAAIVLNVSRGIIAEVERRYAHIADVYVLNVSCSEATLRQRLNRRGRECPADIERRIARALEDVPRGSNVISLVNEGTIAEGCELITAVLQHRLRYSLWLLPDSADPRTPTISALIRQLASDTESADPAFPPHITLCPSFSGSPRDATNALHIATSAVRDNGSAGGIAVEFDGVSVSAARHRAVVLEARHTDTLVRASSKAQAAVSSRGPSPDVYKPHMSLVYGEFTPTTLSRLAGEVIADTDHVQASPLRFSRMAVVMTSGYDCRCWYVVAEAVL